MSVAAVAVPFIPREVKFDTNDETLQRLAVRMMADRNHDYSAFSEIYRHILWLERRCARLENPEAYAAYVEEQQKIAARQERERKERQASSTSQDSAAMLQNAREYLTNLETMPVIPGGLAERLRKIDEARVRVEELEGIPLRFDEVASRTF